MRVRRVAVGAVVLTLAATAVVVGWIPAAADDDTFDEPAPVPTLSSPDRDAFLADTTTTTDNGGAEASRAITVTPDTDLVDGQLVTVDGSGFGDDPITGIFPCAKAMGIDGCDFSSVELFNPNATTFSREVHVDAILHTEAGVIDCRTHVAGCRLVANEAPSLASAAKADLHFDPDGPLEPPPALAVDPSTDLVDEQVVHVTGGDARPDESLLLAQCPVGATELYERCENFWGVVADANGDFELDYQVEAVFQTYDYSGKGDGPSEGSLPPDAVDCRVEACELVVTADERLDRAGRAGLSFDPDAPLRPDMAISVVPNQDLVDGQVVDVRAAGMTPDGPVDVVECSLTSDLEGGGCELDRVQHLTADANGETTTTYTVNDVLDTASGPIECRNYSGCILVAIDRSVPIDFGRGYVFQYLDFAGDDVVSPADPIAATPAFTG